MKPNLKVIKKWVAALRSGRYLQGQHALRRGKRYCCLGVLCDLNRLEGGGGWILGVEESSFVDKNGKKTSVGYLPEFVMSWAGLDSFDPFIGRKRLSFQNDEGVPFEKIADAIESHFLKRKKHAI